LEFQLLSAGVVVAAEAHNPSILHPTFLTSQRIVPESWRLAEPPLCTPPISIVKFDNGIIFTVESSKLQVLQNDPPEELDKAQVAELADKYIAALPHVRYSAVGVNFVAFAQTDAPEKFLIDRFLKSGSWNNDECVPSTLGVRLVYPAEPGELRFSCNAGSIEPASGSTAKQGIIVNANFHLDIRGSNWTDGAKTAISLFGTRCTQFTDYIKRILEAKA